MACEDIELATTLASAINDISKDLIYLVPTGSKMEEAAKKLNMRIACEIFADRNYGTIGQNPYLFWASIGHSPYSDGRHLWATPYTFEL